MADEAGHQDGEGEHQQGDHRIAQDSGTAPGMGILGIVRQGFPGIAGLQVLLDLTDEGFPVLDDPDGIDVPADEAVLLGIGIDRLGVLGGLLEAALRLGEGDAVLEGLGD